MSRRLEGKVALIAGCGSVGPGWGNGKAIAVLFAREGARVFGCDINTAAAEETQSIIRGDGGECEVYQANVAVGDQVRTLVARCVERFGAVDVLLNNVGGSTYAVRTVVPEAISRASHRRCAWAISRGSSRGPSIRGASAGQVEHRAGRE
jgi:NAD(P)-dependent dehydrogenase (short-subunit alcohol dehydrogenase family)